MTMRDDMRASRETTEKRFGKRNMTKQEELFQRLANDSKEEQAAFLFFMFGYIGGPWSITNFGEALTSFYVGRKDVQ